jgi:hypothetical protein
MQPTFQLLAAARHASERMACAPKLSVRRKEANGGAPRCLAGADPRVRPHSRALARVANQCLLHGLAGLPARTRAHRWVGPIGYLHVAGWGCFARV